jgi:hypothetical protein
MSCNIRGIQVSWDDAVYYPCRPTHASRPSRGCQLSCVQMDCRRHGWTLKLHGVQRSFDERFRPTLKSNLADAAVASSVSTGMNTGLRRSSGIVLV